MARRARCICDWPDDCGGTGVLMCDGCGGDQCVCTCGGEMECYGCEACGDGLDYEDCYDGESASPGARE
jgi:hypothetical protein